MNTHFAVLKRGKMLKTEQKPLMLMLKYVEEKMRCAIECQSKDVEDWEERILMINYYYRPCFQMRMTIQLEFIMWHFRFDEHIVFFCTRFHLNKIYLFKSVFRVKHSLEITENILIITMNDTKKWQRQNTDKWMKNQKFPCKNHHKP